MDGTTFAVREGVRRRGYAASHALLYGMFGGMEMNGIQSIVTMLDALAISILTDLGLNFQTIPGTSTQPYFGSEATTPSYAHLPALLSAQQELAPRWYQSIGLGIGLAGVEVPPKHELKLARN
jgi:hypothetical protein